MNNISFLVSQFIGFEALILLLISYRKKEIDKILMVQSISSLLYVVHYLLLGAYSGFLVCSLDFIRDYMYYKTDKDKIIFLYLSLFYIAIGILNYSKIIDLLPMIASEVDGYILLKHQKVILVGSIFCSIIWIFYDLSYKSYIGIITSLIIIISNLSVLIFHKNLFDTKPLSKRK